MLLIYAQRVPKKIYFFADTSAKNRIMDISVESNILKYFTIYCPCMDKDNNFAQFMWIRKKGESKPSEVIGKPTHKYISFKDLAERIAKYVFSIQKHSVYI